MARGMILCLSVIVLGGASVLGQNSNSLVSSSIREGDLLRVQQEIEALKFALQAEEQKGITLLKLNEAQRSLNQELLRQLDDVRKGLDGNLKDQSDRFKIIQTQRTEEKSAAETLLKENQELLKSHQELLKVQEAKTQESEKLKREIESLSEKLKTEQAANKELRDRNTHLLDQVADLNLKLAHAQKQNLMLQEKLATAVASQPPPPPAVNPMAPSLPSQPMNPMLSGEVATKSPEKPSEAAADGIVRGRVREIDPKRFLVVIDRGAADGLKRNDTLEIFRLSDDPRRSLYLGQLTILRTTDREAIARFVPATRERMPMVGDQVASSLVNK